MTNRKKQNKEMVKRMLESNPKTTHVYVKRWGMDGAVIDIPIRHIQLTIENNPFWEVLSSNRSMDAAIEKLFEDDTASTPEYVAEKKVDTLEVPNSPSTAEVLSAVKSLNLEAGDTLTAEDAKRAVETLKNQPTLYEQVIDSTPSSGVVNVFKCDKCEFVAKTKAGLSLHSKKHV